MRKVITLALVLLIIYMAMPFLYLLGPAKIKDYVYRELCYNTMMDNIAAVSSGLPDMLDRTCEFVYRNIDSHNVPAVIDDTSWDCFLRGYGYCDQQAWAFSTLLAKHDIPSRMAMLRGDKFLSGHTVAEVYLNGKWRVVDPHVNKVYYTSGGEMATYDDMQRDDVDISNAVSEGLTEAVYRSYFGKAYPPERWSPLTEKVGTIRKIMFSPVYVYYKLFGRKFTEFYQRLYLSGTA